MNRSDLTLRNKLLVGLSLSYMRLIQQKQIEDGSLIFVRDGEIVKIKARELSHNIEYTFIDSI